MAAIRVMVGLLLVPGLNGTWLVRGLVAGTAADNSAAFATGTVTINASGTVTTGNPVTALNESFQIAPGSFVVSADGRMTGTLGIGTDDSAFEGRLVRDGVQAATVDGILVIEPDGSISGGTLTSIVNEAEPSELTGTLRLDAAGNFTGTLSIPSLAETSTFTGRMTSDKTLMLGATDRQLADARQLGLFEMARLPSADAPSARQIQPGTWHLVSLQVQADQGTVGESLVGTLEVGPGGAITGGVLIGLDGQVDTIVEGGYSTPSSGEVLWAGGLTPEDRGTTWPY